MESADRVSDVTTAKDLTRRRHCLVFQALSRTYLNADRPATDKGREAAFSCNPGFDPDPSPGCKNAVVICSLVSLVSLARRGLAGQDHGS